ncbi:MAG: serine/threonine protein kinase, partial [Planctomycetota bacterium]
MLANELIDRLEKRGLLDQEIIEALREQLDQGARVTPEAVVKLLVDNGQLTKFQASKVIGELRGDQYDEADQDSAVDDVLDLLDGVVPEVEAVAEPLDEPEAVAVAEPVVEAAVMATPVEADPISDAPPPGGRPQRRPKPIETKSVWDSFKIYGFGGILAILVLVVAGLAWILASENADDFIARADKLYDNQNYEPAQEQYQNFLEQYGRGNQYSSRARTRVVMTQLYRAERVPDPTKAMELAKAKLPEIEDEPGLDSEERNNLAGLLVKIAENIANAASQASETTEKQRLLEKLDQQIELTENPTYVTSGSRTALSGKFLKVAEDRARVKRDIDRNLRLDAAVSQMKASLSKQQTKDSYDTRKELLRDFPELETNDRLVKLIQEASGIQQKLVKPATKLPQLLEPSQQEQQEKSIVLTTLEGDPVPGAEGEILYLRAGGSVLAFDVSNGKLLWRRFVGFGDDY